MSAGDGFRPIEYPDASGYPDGAGFLDEGTVLLIDEVTVGAVHALDRPSADTESEVRVRHDAEDHVYAAIMAGRRIASMRYDVVAGRIIVLATTVDPEFRGRGIAADLIADALDDIRERHLRVSVRCPVVAAFIARNQPFADLLAPTPYDA